MFLQRLSKINWLHDAFEVGVFAKFVHGLGELLGAGLLLFKANAIGNWLYYLTFWELQEDPHDWLALQIDKFGNYLVMAKHGFPEFYLFSHGLINALLALALWSKKMWAYPTAITVLTLFVLYQFYRYSHTHSVVLLLVAVWDIVVIWLTIGEYRRVVKSHGD